MQQQYTALAVHIYIYKTDERHIVSIPLLKFGDFYFRIKQKTLSYVNTKPFLRLVYCKDTFFVQYDALFSDYYSLLLKERYTFQKRFFIAFRFTSLHGYILYLCRQAP